LRMRAFRVGVDLDHPSQLQLLKSYFNAKAFFLHSQIEVTETGHGFHIRIYHACPSIEKNLDARRNLGDDPNRLMFDENRKVHLLLHDWVDTLFSLKLNKGKLTAEEPCNVLSLPFTSKLPCRKNYSRRDIK
jgi:hypothetical protein